MSFDYQTVKVVALTQPVLTVEVTIPPETHDYGYCPGSTYNRAMLAEEFITYAARVSNPGNQNNTKTADRLIRYLIKNQHWSPFEMVHATLEIKTTRDIGRQILRHRSFSFQEFSQRYAEVEPELIFRQRRLQDVTNRQKSIVAKNNTPEELDKHYRWKEMQADAQLISATFYREALEQGIAKEQARALLPEGLTPTTMYMAGSLRSWIHWLQIRGDEATTQLEHCDIAAKAKAALLPHFPNVFKALEVE